ncbi:MAG: tetratricopeptide repeat protein [Myxococcota bacterium]|nr:tetratricopeptide repeat protein [Myxococcota bacterium]
MPSFDPRESFESVARGPDARIDLARTALLVAAEEYPRLEVDEYLSLLDELAAAVAPRLEACAPKDRPALLSDYLFREQGFAGNEQDYDDPRNSFLNDVLDRRCGIPITLSLVTVEVARRAGLLAFGIGFPGHFLARVYGDEDHPGLIVDPFHGRILSEDDCAALLQHFMGPEAHLVPHLHLRPATPRETLVRLLGNLKHLYVRRRDFGRALACSERILLLVPAAPLELRDRGLIYEQLECYDAARSDLKRFLQLAPEDESVPAVKARIVALQGKTPRLH